MSSQEDWQPRAIQERARGLARHVFAPRAAEIDASETYPRKNVEALLDAGLMGMTIPAAYGGAGASCLDVVLAVEEIAKACATTARIVVDANLGALGAVMTYGTEEQRKIVAEHVLGGDKPAICITEPEAGSAATDMATTAERRDNVFVLNGTKHWITGGGVSQVHLVFARVVGRDQAPVIAGFLAFTGQEGLRIGRREPTLGLRGCPEAEVIMEDLQVPADMALWSGEDHLVDFPSLMAAYNSQRLGAAAVALGISAGAYELACDYTKNREQFGRPICEFQGVQWMLADMDVRLSAVRSLLRDAAARAGHGFPSALDAARAKVLAAETAVWATSQSLQLFGAAGYSRRFPMERMFRDARMFMIGGGTTQVLRNLIASAVLERKLPQRRGGYLPGAGDRDQM